MISLFTTLHTLFFFLNDTATPEISPLPLHDALPISLPVKYRSSVVLTLDSPIGRELPKRFSTLSPAAQSAVTPYLMPPIYKGSWGDAATAPAGPVAPPRSRTLDAVDCASGLQPPGWAAKTTAPFRIPYRSPGPSSNRA